MDMRLDKPYIVQVDVSCTHCWHYKPNVTAQPYEVCCWCGEQRSPGSMMFYGPHGPHS